MSKKTVDELARSILADAPTMSICINRNDFYFRYGDFIRSKVLENELEGIENEEGYAADISDEDLGRKIQAEIDSIFNVSAGTLPPAGLYERIGAVARKGLWGKFIVTIAAVRLQEQNAAKAKAESIFKLQQDNRLNNIKMVDDYCERNHISRSDYYKHYLDKDGEWPSVHGEYLVSACLQDNGIAAWPGDGVGIIAGIIDQYFKKALKAEERGVRLEAEAEGLRRENMALRAQLQERKS